MCVLVLVVYGGPTASCNASPSGSIIMEFNVRIRDSSTVIRWASFRHYCQEILEWHLSLDSNVVKRLLEMFHVKAFVVLLR